MVYFCLQQAHIRSRYLPDNNTNNMIHTINFDSLLWYAFWCIFLHLTVYMIAHAIKFEIAVLFMRSVKFASMWDPFIFINFRRTNKFSIFNVHFMNSERWHICIKRTLTPKYTLTNIRFSDRAHVYLFVVFSCFDILKNIVPILRKRTRKVERKNLAETKTDRP